MQTFASKVAKKSATLAMMLGCMISLSGCLTTNELHSFEGPNRSYTLKQEPMFYTVQFAPGKSDIGAEEQKAIESFVKNFDPKKGEQISVSFTAGLDSDQAHAAANQSKSVVEFLRKLDINPGISANPPHIGADQVGVIRMTPKLVMPDCPNWQKPGGSDYGNTVYSNYNCANAYNLGAMVANPMDLVSPAPMSPADAQGSVLSIQRYRTDKVKELTKETPTTLNE